jgi:hypothetical protein
MPGILPQVMMEMQDLKWTQTNLEYFIPFLKMAFLAPGLSCRFCLITAENILGPTLLCFSVPAVFKYENVTFYLKIMYLLQIPEKLSSLSS